MAGATRRERTIAAIDPGSSGDRGERPILDALRRRREALGSGVSP